MTDEADDWGANEPLKHPHLNLLGPSGKKRRRLSKSFKDAVGLQAMADKRSNTVSGMLKAVAPEMQEQSHRITHEMLWEHKAATEHLALVPHAASRISDGRRVGKPARESLHIYLWRALQQIASCLPPAVSYSRDHCKSPYMCMNIRVKTLAGWGFDCRLECLGG